MDWRNIFGVDEVGSSNLLGPTMKKKLVKPIGRAGKGTPVLFEHEDYPTAKRGVGEGYSSKRWSLFF